METKPTKAWVAAIGASLTAASTAWAAVSLALSDGAVDVPEISSLATAAVVLVATVYSVWRVPNAPKG